VPPVGQTADGLSAWASHVLPEERAGPAPPLSVDAALNRQICADEESACLRLHASRAWAGHGQTRDDHVARTDATLSTHDVALATSAGAVMSVACATRSTAAAGRARISIGRAGECGATARLTRSSGGDASHRHQLLLTIPVPS
jgi:hypothetical protein